MKDKPLFKAPCNITIKNSIELIDKFDGKKFSHECVCVRYKCGKIKWKKKGYKKIRRKNENSDWY